MLEVMRVSRMYSYATNFKVRISICNKGRFQERLSKVNKHTKYGIDGTVIFRCKGQEKKFDSKVRMGYKIRNHKVSRFLSNES